MPAFVQRGRVRIAREEWADARKDFDEAVRLGPNLAYAFVARSSFLAACPDEKSRDAPQAFKDATRACELTEWKDPYPLATYAVSLAALGDFESAVKWQKKAMEDAGYRNDVGAAARKRLEWYESRLPGGPPKTTSKKD